MSRDPDALSEPVSLDEIHEVLGDIEERLEAIRPSWPAVTALSLYALALAVTRVLEIREGKP